MLRFTVYDKSLTRLGYVQATTDPSKPKMTDARVVLRHNKPGSAEFTVDADHHMVPALAAPGARVVVEYRPQAAHPALGVNPPWRREMSGRVSSAQGEGHPATRTFTVADDKSWLWTTSAWPLPTAAVGSQSDTHWVRRGPAETVVKALVGANATRSGAPVVVAADQGRGGTISVQARFDYIADVLFPAVDQAGLGVTILQPPSGPPVVDVYPKRVHTTPLSDRSGVITGETSYTMTGPTVTRVVVGAGGEGEARFLREYIDHARETEWGVRLEAFRDARDIKPTLAEQPDRNELMADRANEVLAEGAPTASLSLELAETEHFRYGNAVLLGDVVKASVAGGPILTDTVTEVHITQTSGDGVTVVPIVGDRASTPDNPDAVLAKAVAAALRGVRRIETRS